MRQKKALPLRHTRAYRLLVWAFRCHPVALVLGGLTMMSTLVDVPALTAALAGCTAAVMLPGVVLALTGMIMLYAGGLMPQDLTRRQAMTGMLWRDVVKPLKRP
ncbi:hypothetical protein AB0H63_30900 [Micromonospora echinospora]|uniref:hypothetical protein n=1 Tax=Micromonospora echinospora TaxID=1877 RepID=UPI003402556C